MGLGREVALPGVATRYPGRGGACLAPKTDPRELEAELES